MARYAAACPLSRTAAIAAVLLAVYAGMVITAGVVLGWRAAAALMRAARVAVVAGNRFAGFVSMCFIGFSFRRAGRRGRYSRGRLLPTIIIALFAAAVKLSRGQFAAKYIFSGVFQRRRGGASNRPMTAILRGLCKVVYSYTDLKIFGFFILILL